MRWVSTSRCLLGAGEVPLAHFARAIGHGADIVEELRSILDSVEDDGCRLLIKEHGSKEHGAKERGSKERGRGRRGPEWRGLRGGRAGRAGDRL